MLGDYFDGCRESLILIPKKNGKTTLLAALALFHLCTTDNAACYIGAASRDQATILYDQARGLVERSEWLADEVDVKAGYRQIRSRRDSGMIRVLAADAGTADGVLPTLALVDELHRHKSADLYGVFRDGLGPRDGRMMTISTAGDDEDSPLGQLRARAYREGVKQKGAYRTVRTRGFAMHEWALEPDADVTDLELVKTANPAPWQTVEALAERLDSPSMTPWAWARFACGIWGQGAERAFDPELWAELESLNEQIPEGATVCLGFDGARRRDTTALVAVDVKTGLLNVVGYWPRPLDADDEWEIPEEEVDEAVAHAFDRWKVFRLYGDPPYWETALDRWAGEYGKETVVRWWTNRVKLMALALRAFRNDMRSRALSHDGDVDLADHVRNAVVRKTKMIEDDEPLWTISKESSSSERKIDLVMAAVLAWKARGDAIRLGADREKTYSIASWSS